MLPDWPEIKREMNRRFRRRLEEAVEQKAPLAARIARRTIYEGDQLSLEDSLGDITVTKTRVFSSPFRMDRKDHPLEEAAGLAESIDKTADDMARQQMNTLFTTVSESSNRAGTSIHAGNQPFTPELFLQMLATIEIDFDEHGRPEMPTVVMHPDQFKRVRPVLEAAERDRNYQRRFNQLMERKKLDFYDRQSHCKLVD